MGRSQDDLRDFPEDARGDAGYQLGKVQRGLEPSNWKPMTTVGVGVREIRVTEQSGAFRVIYVATRAEAVYVLHRFQKKTQKTSRHDLDLARERFGRLPREAQ